MTATSSQAGPSGIGGWRYVVAGELVVNAALFIWAGTLLYLFFGKRRSFPRSGRVASTFAR